MKDSNTDSFYKILQQMPLISGLSSARIQEIVGHTKLEFLKFKADDVITKAGQACTHIKLLINGSVRMTMQSAVEDFVVEQTLMAPQALSPDYLFGLTTSYPCTVKALEPCGIMQISKEDFRRLLTSDTIILLNMLNTLSSNSQRATNGLLSVTSGEPLRRLAYWVVTLTQADSVDIVLKSASRPLHQVFGIAESDWHNVVKEFAERGVVTFDSVKQLHVSSRSRMLPILQ